MQEMGMNQIETEAGLLEGKYKDTKVSRSIQDLLKPYSTTMKGP